MTLASASGPGPPCPLRASPVYPLHTIGRIRREHLVGKRSIREISRLLRVSRKVVRKALREPETQFAYVREVQPRPRLGVFIERLESLLAENAGQSARERLTARRLHELLRAEGYTGAYDSVQRHVRDWRRDQGKTSAAFVPLWFAPGEAYQFDWSHETVVLDGVTTEVKVAHVRLCRSRMFFLRAYPRETQEMVFDAHNQAFRFFWRGVPARHLRQHADRGGCGVRWP